MIREEINNVRITINDPGDVLEIIELPSAASLPAVGENQVAYHLNDSGHYMIWTGSDYEQSDLFVSDSQIASVVGKLGIDSGVCRLFSLIARRLGSQLRVTRITTGAEQTEYLRLQDAYQYYKQLSDDCKADQKKDQGQNTGRIGGMKKPVIAEGLI